jgi:hypothetical protein
MPFDTLLLVGGIVALFLLFMGVLMWCDAQGGSERQ